jgi:glyoxylase-like metal-dependent hydrolase (beta-lactamase superfamily II)
MRYHPQPSSSVVRRPPSAVALLTLAALAACAGSTPSPSAAAPAGPSYEIYAIRYATLPRFRVSGLIAGADTSRRLDIAMMVWLVTDRRGRNVLVDAGFHRPDLLQRWRPTNFEPPSVAVARARVNTAEVTDIIISHVHWDHFDGVDLFPNAIVWIQREEFEHHVDAQGKSLDRALDSADAVKLSRLARSGRLRLVEGDGREILPGITVYTGGKHTYQSQYVGVRTGNETVVLASDNVYLYENLDKRLPIAQTLDAESNVRAQDRMRTLATDPRLIIPGHDPAVFDRFRAVGPGVARIR